MADIYSEENFPLFQRVRSLSTISSEFFSQIRDKVHDHNEEQAPDPNVPLVLGGLAVEFMKGLHADEQPLRIGDIMFAFHTSAQNLKLAKETLQTKYPNTLPPGLIEKIDEALPKLQGALQMGHDIKAAKLGLS